MADVESTANMIYDQNADILTIQFKDTSTVVHYVNENVAVLCDEISGEVVGFHIEGWSKFSAEMQHDYLEYVNYVPSPQPVVIRKTAKLVGTYIRPPIVIDLEDDDYV